MRLFKYILGTLAGMVVFSIVNFAVYFVISFVGKIPIIGSILYYPSDAAWALIALPAPTATFAAAWISNLISKSAKPICALIAIWGVAELILTIISSGWVWGTIVTLVFMIGAACICFEMKFEERKGNMEVLK